MDPGTIRLIASDLDGTLLGTDSQVSARTTATIRAVTAREVHFVVATGRSQWSAVPRLEHLTGSVRWVLCSNGATLYDLEGRDVIRHRAMADDELARTIDVLRHEFPTVGFAWETPSGLHYTERWRENRRATEVHPEPGRDTSELRVGDEPVLKLMVAHDRLVRYDWLDAMGPLVPETLNASTSGATFVEVTAPGANKGDALADLCAELGVAPAETVAFGDHSNDETMLRWVGRGYAMANADPRILAVADATAPHHANDGVATVIEELLLD